MANKRWNLLKIVLVIAGLVWQFKRWNKSRARETKHNTLRFDGWKNKVVKKCLLGGNYCKCVFSKYKLCGSIMLACERSKIYGDDAKSKIQFCNFMLQLLQSL